MNYRPQEENEELARGLPVETKQKFWKAMIEGGMNLGEAREHAGIDDLMVAGALVIQCHSTLHVPMKVSEIL